MQIAAPPSQPLTGGYLLSPAFTVTIDDSGDWGILGITWQEPACGCAQEFPICVAHVKSDPNEPAVGSATPTGIESSFACSPPFKMDSLSAMAIATVENSTEYHIARKAAEVIGAIAPINPAPYGMNQGFAALISSVFPSGRGVIHVSPYVATLMVVGQLAVVDGVGNLTSAIGGHHVIANPFIPNNKIAWTGYGSILLSTIMVVNTFDQNNNKQRVGAERHAAIGMNMCAAQVVTITVPAASTD